MSSIRMTLWNRFICYFVCALWLTGLLGVAGVGYGQTLRLVVRKEAHDLNSLADLQGKVVGTLKFSLAHRLLEAHRGIDVRSYEGQINAYDDLANGRLDAVLMDHPIALAVVAGLALTLVRLYGPEPLAWLAGFYVEVARGTPLLIQLYLIFYALPNVGIKLSPFVAALVGLGCNYAAYEAENYRAGILSIPAAMYFVIGWPFVRLSRFAELRFAFDKRKSV